MTEMVEAGVLFERRPLESTALVETAIASMVVSMILPSAWAASPGELDPTFSDDGYVLLPELQCQPG